MNNNNGVKTKALSIQIQSLNDTFADHIQRLASNPDTLTVSWKSAVEDYLSYVRMLKHTYNPDEGYIYSWGTGDCAQLGHGMNKDGFWIENTRPKQIKAFKVPDVERISAGGIHNVVLTSKGEVYTWGCNDDWALGRDGVEHLPFVVPGLNKISIIQVGAGDCHSLALTRDGRIYGWGAFRDKDGKKFWPMQSAAKSFKYTQKTPKVMDDFLKSKSNNSKNSERIVDIICGSCFNYARASSGRLYSWGLGESGELGRIVGDVKNKEQEYNKDIIYNDHLLPQIVLRKDEETGTNVPVQGCKAVGCGAYHTIFTTSEGDGNTVYATGLNNYGQLGLTEAKGVVEKWRKIPEVVPLLKPFNICQIQAGEHHSVVLTVQGQVYSFGRGDSGQLGRKGPDDSKGQVQEGYFDSTPGRVGAEMKGHAIKQITCGSNHTICVSTRSKVFAWGYGDNGSLGHGKADGDLLFPEMIREKELKTAEGYSVVQVEAGGQHSCLILAKNQVGGKRKSY